MSTRPWQSSARGSRCSKPSATRSSASRPAWVGAAGLSVHPLEPAGDDDDAAIRGSAEQIANALRTFREGGFSQVDLMLSPGTVEAIDALAPVVEMLRAE